MKDYKYFGIWVLLLCSITVAFQLKAESRNDHPIDLKEYVHIFTNKNIQIKTRGVDWKNSKLATMGEQAKFDPILTIESERNGNHKRNTVQEQLTLSSLSEFKENNTTYGANISKKTATGATVLLNVDSSDLYNNVQPNFVRGNEHVWAANISIIQPLMKNKGIGATAPIEIAKIGEKLSFQLLREAFFGELSEAIIAYWDLYQADAIVNLRIHSLDLISQMYETSKDKVRQGNIPITEVMTLKSQLGTARSKLNLANQKRNKALNLAKQYLAERSITNSTNYITKSEGLLADLRVINKPMINVKERMRFLLGHNPRYLGKKAQMEQENIKLVFANNQVLPEFDFTVNYGVNGLAKTEDDAVNDALSNDFSKWSIGLRFLMPLSNDGVKSQLDTAKYKKYQALNDIKESEIILGNRLSAVVENLNFKYINIQEHKAVLDVEQSIYNIKKKSYEKSKGTIDELITSEKRLVLAQEQVLLSLVDYQKTIFILKELDGSLLEYFEIDEIGGVDGADIANEVLENSGYDHNSLHDI